MLVGLALMAVPLLVAILIAVLQIRDLSDTGQKIVLQGVINARASQALFGQIASLERTARLYDVLSDPKLLEPFRTQDGLLTKTREQLHRQAGPDIRHTLEAIGQLQQVIRTTVIDSPTPKDAAAQGLLDERFTQLTTLVEQVAQQSNKQVDAQIAALQARTLQARQRLLWTAAPAGAARADRHLRADARDRPAAAPARSRHQRARPGHLHQPDRRHRSP